MNLKADHKIMWKLTRGSRKAQKQFQKWINLEDLKYPITKLYFDILTKHFAISIGQIF